jgi:hypothetical protein
MIDATGEYNLSAKHCPLDVSAASDAVQVFPGAQADQVVPYRTQEQKVEWLMRD